ncbi:MAG TPA: gluconate 2-dehydrogenase subunit 3 family protein [Rhodanobacteraceae bacterium]|nr:gluconate 2-dehydrogenase subunit 3 family protein [Rhodanobacteraceae bacterium]
MPERFPGYDVMARRDTASWNDATRKAIDARLATRDSPEFFNPEEWRTLDAICERIVPQASGRMRVPTAALVDRKLAEDRRDGYRDARLPPLREAWRRGLAALEAAAQVRAGAKFHALTASAQDTLLRDMQHGRLDGEAWGDMPAELFFKERVMHDILAAYYSHPESWNEIGFGGPAGPRGYVRMYFNRRDPWEAAEAKPGRADKARKTNQHAGSLEQKVLTRMNADDRG